MADKKEKEREGDDGEVHAQSERDGELPFPNFRPYPRNIIALARSAAIGNGHKSFLAHNFAHIF